MHQAGNIIFRVTPVLKDDDTPDVGASTVPIPQSYAEESDDDDDDGDMDKKPLVVMDVVGWYSDREIERYSTKELLDSELEKLSASLALLYPSVKSVSFYPSPRLLKIPNLNG